MATDYQKFVFSPDKHWGYTNQKGKLQPIHDEKAIMAMLEFARDFKPDVWIEGGDSLDLSGISHWNKSKPLDIESLEIDRDMEEYDEQVLMPIDELMGEGRKEWLEGNHEAWLEQVKQSFPALRGSATLNLEKKLDLRDRGWRWRDQGIPVSVGKLLFVHGDTINGGEHVAKKAVLDYNANVRFGHHHTHQVYTKHSPVSTDEVKTGMAVGCLCNRNPLYNKRRPNKWVTGFNYGYVFRDGTYSDFHPVIINGKFAAEGKVYRG